MPVKGQRAAALAAGLGLAVCGRSPAPPRLAAGLVVEAVEARSVAERAGLRSGDRLSAWSPLGCPALAGLPPGGSLGSPLEVVGLEQELSPRCEVALRGERAGAAFTATLGDGAWGLTLRPSLPESHERMRRAALAAEGSPRESRLRWRQLAGSLAGRDACWAWLQAAARAARAQDWPEAGAAFEEARVAARAAGDPLAEAQAWTAEARARWDANQLDRAHAGYQAALGLQEAVARDGLSVATTLNRMGFLAIRRGDLELAEQALARAYALRERWSPRSYTAPRTLNNLGSVALQRGRLDQAARTYSQALALARACGTSGLEDVDATLNNLALVARARGDLAEAERLQRESLGIAEQLDPGGASVATNHVNLATLSTDRGDLASAEEGFRRALEIWERRAPGSPEVALSFHNLGDIKLMRGDLDSAEDLLRRGLALREQLSPLSVEAATSLSALAELYERRADLAQAERYERRALELRERLAPGGPEHGVSLRRLARIARARGGLEQARALLARALDMHRRQAPQGLLAADALADLGQVALERGAVQEAEGLQRQALAIRRRLAPASAPCAEAWHALALTLRRRAGLLEALAAFQQALDVLEAVQGRVGGADDVRSGFAGGYAGFYRDTVELLLELRRPAAAFHALERSRARSLRAALAERDLVFADAPPELERQRRELAAAYEREQARAQGLDAERQREDSERIVARLRELRDERAALDARMRAKAPRLAELRAPEALDLEGVRASLDAGTLLLSYSVGREQTLLFVVRASADPGAGLRTLRLPLGEPALRARAAFWRGLIERGRTGDADPLVCELGAKLYADLVGPAEPEIQGARRLLIAPDGPLHALPFAALCRRSSPPEYLGEWKPLHTASSLALYRAQRERRPNSPKERLSFVAFGDPLGRGGGAPDAGAALPLFGQPDRRVPLPAARDEVQRVAALFPPGSALAYLGAEATEERARGVRSTRYLHFATHALLEARLPLDSALVLSAPPPGVTGRENGLLQAWEIFEQLRLEADLVTLSACSTGLGRELNGEGLVGLSRAFQFAGARSVLASLWTVSDRSTSELMVRFYAGLRAGLPKDEALQAAQLALLRGSSGARPFHWAAFQLSGDWR